MLSLLREATLCIVLVPFIRSFSLVSPSRCILRYLWMIGRVGESSLLVFRRALFEKWSGACLCVEP